MLKCADRGWGKVWLCIGIAEEVDVDKLVGLKVWRGNVFDDLREELRYIVTF